MALPACEGTLFKYGPAAAHVAFQPASAPARANVIVALGGLTDGFFATPYLEPLAARAAALGWGLVTPLLRSSHTGWGVASLAQDVEDLARLSDHLGGERGAAALALVGHSTGCQDAVAYAGSQSAAPGPPHRPALAAIVLQAPVSDKEWLAGRESTAARLEAAAAAVAVGEPEALIGRAAEWDLTGGELEERLCKPLARVARVLVLGSGREQYAPPGADAQASARRLAAAIGPAAQAIVLDGDHSLAGVEEEAARVIADFVCAGA
jgi:hypothetical protein